jgi:hypothetical protein
MRVFLKPSEDATVYQRYPTINSGLDEVIEIGKLINSTDGNNLYSSGSCRILMNFDITESMFPSESRYFLNLYLANARDIDKGQQIEIYPISQNWNEGSGYFYQITETQSNKGVTWKNLDTNISWSVEGGTFSSQPSASTNVQQRPLKDVRVEITNLISPVVAGTNVTPWNGIILKYPNVDEISSLVISNIKLFSSNTYTIFSPKLEVVWNDQVFITGSLRPIPNINVSILPKNIKQSYIDGEISKVYLVVRDKYPDRRYDTTQRYKSIYYLPSSSYFRIRDTVSDVELYKFDIYSYISCDSGGSYIMLDTRGLEPNRYYNIDLKVEMSDGQVFFPEFDYQFKVKSDE